MKEMDEVKKVVFLLSQWVAAVRIFNARGYTDINRVSEDLTLRLLNALYDYDLTNLNWTKSNYPGIDLACEKSGIAFQVTSENTLSKIKEGVKTFFGSQESKSYANGLRFLLLADRKLTITKKQKQAAFWKKYPDFDLDHHIIAIPELMAEIERCYSEDRDRFDMIKTLLEDEFGFGEKKIKRRELLEKIFNGSRHYHDDLRGSGGRFRHLDISEIILSPAQQQKRQGFIDTPVQLNEESDDSGDTNSMNVLEAIPRIWKEDCVHAMLVGEGGMGKTVSLIRLWENLLDDKNFNAMVPVPIFIPLNEFNETISDEDRKDFIKNMIRKHYLEGKDKDLELSDILKRPLREESSDTPSLILLLDGFNEVTIDNRLLDIELRNIIEHWKGVQIIISSRLDMRDEPPFTDAHIIKLLGLEEAAILQYLDKHDISLSNNELTNNHQRLLGLLKNPMMLTIYASTCEAQDAYKNNSNYEFKTNVESPGELLWNFIETQVIKYFSQQGLADKDKWLHRFLLKHLLPAIGYKMESEGRFEFDYQSLASSIDSFLANLSKNDFFCTFPSYAIQEDHLPLQESGIQISHKQKAELIDKLTEKLLMLVKEGTTYRFLHQNFRDFFAAIHILNEAKIALTKNKLPALLTDQTISFYPRQYIGEIEGEHHCKPYLEPDIGWKIKDNSHTILAQCLEQCRNIFDGSTQLAIWNILEIWKQVRGEWTGLDLSRLDLTKVTINSVACSRFFKTKYFSACFNDSLIHSKNILYQGHNDIVRDATYSPKGDYILSASGDETIKKWSVETGEVLKTFNVNPFHLASACYSPDGSKIFSASFEGGIVREFDESRNILSEFRVCPYKITSAIYNSDGRKILITCDEYKIIELETSGGKNVSKILYECSHVTWATYSPNDQKILFIEDDNIIKEMKENEEPVTLELKGHTDKIISAVYSTDGKRILTASFDNTVKEWDLENATCIRTFDMHKSWVRRAAYSPCGKKILCVYQDRVIKEWDIETGALIRTYNGHTLGYNSADISPDKSKIALGSTDHTMQEWSLQNTTCLHFYIGHSFQIYNVIYSRNGKKILSHTRQEENREWSTETGECLSEFGQDKYSEIMQREYLGGGRRPLNYNVGDQSIKYKNPISGEDDTIKCHPGLWIQGCSFANLHPGSDLSEKDKEILRMYGAKGI